MKTDYEENKQRCLWGLSCGRLVVFEFGRYFDKLAIKTASIDNLLTIKDYVE